MKLNLKNKKTNCITFLNIFPLFFITLFQGLGFTREERQLLGIHGLFPAAVKTEEEQVQHCTLLLNRYESDLDKFIYLMGLYVCHGFAFHFIRFLIVFHHNDIKFITIYPNCRIVMNVYFSVCLHRTLVK